MTRPFFPMVALLCALAASPVPAQDAPSAPAAPLHVAVTRSQTPVKDVLASLSLQSHAPILTDDTVVDTLGVTTLDRPTVPAMLDTLCSMFPGMTWQRVTIPSDAPLPDADSLSAQVRDLQALMASRLTITNSDTHTTISYSRTAGDTSKIADTSDRVAYLVTNEAVRAQRMAAKKARDARAVPDTPIKQIDSDMLSLQSAFSQLTPAEQTQGVMKLSTMMAQVFAGLDPSVMANIQKQAEKAKADMANGSLPPAPAPGP